MSMTIKRRQPDLFATARTENLPLLVQVEAKKLLSLLLNEAVANGPEPASQSNREAGHAEDLRCGVIEPFYPKAGAGRPPIGLERMLRICYLHHWFNRSDPAVEDALYGSSAMRSFARIAFSLMYSQGRVLVNAVGHLVRSNRSGILEELGVSHG
jgi:hypothetical protein